jgi:hypothetical protein
VPTATTLWCRIQASGGSFFTFAEAAGIPASNPTEAASDTTFNSERTRIFNPILGGSLDLTPPPQSNKTALQRTRLAQSGAVTGYCVASPKRAAKPATARNFSPQGRSRCYDFSS